MIPIRPRAIYIKQEAHDDPRSRARIERMLPFMTCDAPPKIIDDAELNRIIVDEGLNRPTNHGLDGARIEPVVLFTQFLYHHTPEQRRRRIERFPEIGWGRWGGWCAGYLGFDWRPSGDAEYRCTTGLVCQPAYALHSFLGCHFRCAYCHLGHVAVIYANVEDWIEHIRAGLATLENAPGQTLFQWDNGTDPVCWEPEYGGTKRLVDLFAEQADKYLELYVGKSDYVDYLLDYDHRGHTVCCWSLGTETQCPVIEPRSASMENRLLAARKCQQAGYPVRIRFSPMVPIAGWEAELRHMTRRMFELIRPEMLTMEPLRYQTYETLRRDYAPGVLDEEFVAALRDMPPTEKAYERQFPDELRLRMYRVVLDEVAAHSPETPVALCREKRTLWDALRSDFERTGQTPDNYVCNCGPTSAGANPLLAR